MNIGFVSTRPLIFKSQVATCIAACSIIRPKMSAGRAPERFILEAIRSVDKLYGDADDENMPYHRWVSAQAAIAQSNLRYKMHSDALVYGEFDLAFFGNAIKIASGLQQRQDIWSGSEPDSFKFVDIGSGYGRLVHAAAYMLPGWECVGIEIIPDMVATSMKFSEQETSEEESQTSRQSKIRFVHGDYTDPCATVQEVLRKARIVFCFATTWPSGSTPYLNTLSAVLGRYLHPGAIVMTVDKQLAPEPVGCNGEKFTLRREIEGSNPATGQSTLYIYELGS